MSIANIEALPILNKKAAIEGLGGVELFENMLEGFEDLSLRKNLTHLKIALDELDYFSIRMQAHSLKGSSSYLRAERVTKIAEKIQNDVEKQQPEEIFKAYPLLIKQCIMLKRTIRFDMLKRQGKQFTEEESDFDLPISKYFRLIKRSYNDFDVIQVAKVTPLPPIPKFKFDKKGTSQEGGNEFNALSASSRKAGADMGESTATGGVVEKHPRIDKTVPDPSMFQEFEAKAPAKVMDKPTDKTKVQAKAKESGALKIEQEQQKTGCNCALL